MDNLVYLKSCNVMILCFVFRISVYTQFCAVSLKQTFYLNPKRIVTFNLDCVIVYRTVDKLI